MNNKEKNAVIAASKAIDGTTPDGAILIRTRQVGENIAWSSKSFGISNMDIIASLCEVLATVVKGSGDIDVEEALKEFTISTLQRSFEGELSVGAVKG